MSYQDELKGLLIEFLKDRIAKAKAAKPSPLAALATVDPLAPADRLDFDEKEGLTDKGVRQLHEGLCRQVGMTSQQIIDEWNLRCPEDPW